MPKFHVCRFEHLFRSEGFAGSHGGFTMRHLLPSLLILTLALTLGCSREAPAPPKDGKWADIAVLEPVRDYKARHASTLLTFDAVVDAIGQIEAKRRTVAAE